MDKSIGERVAALEVQMSAVLPSIERVEQKQIEILKELARYRGAWGLAVMLLSAVGTALILFRDWFLSWFK